MHSGFAASTAVWQHGGITCTLVPASIGYEVELRNASGVAFLRKCTATAEVARNEAESLRLLFEADDMPLSPGEPKAYALVVEDDRAACDALAEALKAIGVRAHGVSHGAEAIRLAKALAPYLIVNDYRLPDMS